MQKKEDIMSINSINSFSNNNDIVQVSIELHPTTIKTDEVVQVSIQMARKPSPPPLHLHSFEEIPFSEEQTPVAFATPKNQPFSFQETGHERQMSDVMHQFIDSATDEMEAGFYKTKYLGNKEFWREETFFEGLQALAEHRYGDAAKAFHSTVQHGVKYKEAALKNLTYIYDEATQKQNQYAAFGLAIFWKHIGNVEEAQKFCSMAPDVPQAQALLEGLQNHHWI